MTLKACPPLLPPPLTVADHRTQLVHPSRSPLDGLHTDFFSFDGQGGDIFHDLAPHDVDFVCFSIGLGEPSEVRLFPPQAERGDADAGAKAY